MKKRSFAEDMKILARGIGIWVEICPKLVVYLILANIVCTVSPFFSLYMSSRLIDGITQGQGAEELLILAAVTVSGVFFLNILCRLVEGRRNIWANMFFQRHMLYMAGRQNRMQYEYIENPEVTLKWEEIFANANATSAGLLKLVWSLPPLVGDISNLVLSTALTVTMFRTLPRAGAAGFLGFVNSAGCAVLFIAFLLLNCLLTVKSTARRTKEDMEAWSELAKSNTAFFAYENKTGEDVVIFDLKAIIVDEIRKIFIRPPYLRKVERINIKYNSIVKLQNIAISAVVFMITAAKAFLGVFGIGSFVFYQGTVLRFAHAVAGIASRIAILRENNHYLLKLYEYLDLPDTMYQGRLAVEKRDDLDYEIEFKDVSFRYPRTQNWVLRHVDMKFNIGDKLAIVGENGSGKTTFIKLLCRLYDPTEGQILLNGIDISKYRYDEYMDLFSVVFQDYKLFEFSLAANVTASLDYDVKRVEESLERAGFGEKLRSLEKGIETVIGRSYDDDGIDLSGGEEQKVAMARALYKDAPFMVLDEPTAALDPVAEAAVYENIHNMVKNRTAVFISHRLSSCRFCDNIVVFDKGRIVQRGSHDELVAREGKYSTLWSAQAQYYT